MLDMPNCFSASRIKSDIQDIESLGELITKLKIPMDALMAEAFQKLVDLAGTKDFFPEYSKIQEIVLKLKWAREGIFNTGYCVPWVTLYSALGTNSQLSSVATRCQRFDGLRSPINHHQPFYNNFGNGCRPVDINQEEWTLLLAGVANGTKKKDLFTNVSYRNKKQYRISPYARAAELSKTTRQGPEISRDYPSIEQDFSIRMQPPAMPIDIPQYKTVLNTEFQKPKPKRAAPYSKSKLLEAFIGMDRLENCKALAMSQTGHAAKAAGPDLPH
jgi:hypothetical protein